MKIVYNKDTRTFSILNKLKKFYKRNKDTIWTLGGLAAAVGGGYALGKFDEFRKNSGLESKPLTDKERERAEEQLAENRSKRKLHKDLNLNTSNLTDSEKDQNVMKHIQTLKDKKGQLMTDLGLSNDEYDKLAKLSLGQVNNESQFGTSDRYKYKRYVPDVAIDFAKFVSGRAPSQRSEGYGQIKYNYLEPYSKLMYEKYGMGDNNLDNSEDSAVAEMIKLAEIYNNNVRGKEYNDREGNKVSDEDAVMYYYTGRGRGLRNSEILPSDNTYIQNAHKYMDQF